MACTIVSTPATGAANWTGWITQQGLTDRGFMAVSLTEFATTAASLIGTGSVFELAGSIYSCSDAEAISLAAGTPSASQAVYYLATPTAGGTTCTFSMEGTAPTWVDTRQGFYASAASVTRYVGGAYLVTLTSYNSKWIYTPDMIKGYLLPMGATRPILKKIIETGEWNMDADAGKSISHNLIVGNIRSINALIRADDGTLYGVNRLNAAWTAEANIEVISTTTLSIQRKADGFFDSVGFDGTASTVANRSWITIEYEA